MRNSYLPHLLLGSRTGRQWGCWFYVFFSGMDQQFCCCEHNPVLNISFEWKYLFHNLKYQPATVKNICSLVNFHIRHLFHIWGTIGQNWRNQMILSWGNLKCCKTNRWRNWRFIFACYPSTRGWRFIWKWRVLGGFKLCTSHGSKIQMFFILCNCFWSLLSSPPPLQ